MTTYEATQYAGRPRPADGDRARLLVEAAQRGAPVELCTLGASELLVLGGARQVLVDDAVSGAWHGLPEERQCQLADEVIEGLTRRGLLDAVRPDEPPGSRPESTRMRMHPALGTVMVARTHPTWLALCSAAGVERCDLRMFGLGDAQDAFRGVVVEKAEAPQPATAQDTQIADGTVGAAYHYKLASTPAAAKMLAEWVVSDHASVSAGAARRVDLFRHLTGEPALRRRFELTVDAAGGIALVSGLRDGGGWRPSYDADSLAELLHQAIRALRTALTG